MFRTGLTLTPVIRRLTALLLVGLISLAGVAQVGARQDDGPPRYKLVPLGTIKNYDSTVALAVNAKGVVVGQAMAPDLFTGRAVIYRGGKLRALIKGEDNFSSEARDINASGQIIVMTTDADGLHTLVWESDEGTTISSPDGDVNLYSINDAGVAVGDVSHADVAVATQPIVWEDGEIVALAVLSDGVNGSALNLNAGGLVVGYSEVAKVESGEAPVRHAVAWEDSEVTDLGTLGGLYSIASGVNAAGQIVGSSSTAEDQPERGIGTHAALWDDGEVIDLGTLGNADVSSASAINTRGDIVGRAGVSDDDVPNHAVLWRDGQIYDLNDLVEGGTDVILENAYDINDNGLIVTYGDLNGFQQAFLLEPMET